jgi:Flp pilus assembly protein TadD
MRVFRLWLLLFAFTIFILATTSARTQSGGSNDDAAGKPPSVSSAPLGQSHSESESTSSAGAPSDYSKEAFVIEHLRSRFRFENDGTGREETTIRVRVQSEAGLQNWGQLRFGYNSANEQLDIVYVRVTKPDGSVVTADDKDVQDLAPTQQFALLYTDYRQKHITVPGLRPGDVLECETVTTIHHPLAPGQFWMQHEFNQSNIVLDEELDIDVPSNRAIKLKTRPGIEPKITQDNGRHLYHWTSSHLVRENDHKDKEKDKKQKKRKPEEFAAVQLTTFTSWEDVGRWYADLEKDRRQPSKEVRSQAEALTKGMKTDLEKVRALYDFVAANFRYVSLSLGMARYQPHAAAEVLHNQYGDCKDKHTLLAALLEAEGMHASAVLINASRNIDADVPSPAQFNHVITLLSLGNDKIWMDTTTEVAPFRLLAYQLRKKQSLVVQQDGVSHLEETPADPPIPDSERTAIEGKVAESGRLEGRVALTTVGDRELAMRMIARRLPAADLRKFVEGLNQKLGLGGEVGEFKVTEPTATHEAFVISYDVTKNNFIDWSKKKVELKLPLATFNPVAVGSDVDADAENVDSASPEPFKLGPPNEQSYRIKLELAPRYKAQVPVAVDVERDYGSYHSSYKLDGDLLTAERTLKTRVGELPVPRANDYRAFRRSVLADVAQFVTIESSVADTHSAPADMKTNELITNGNEARKRGEYELAISLLNRAVEASPKSKSAWNDLGLAYYEAREDELAINAFQKQVEIDSFHQFSYNNLGRVYLGQRRYEEAEKWFRKQIEVNPLDKYAHANLGLTFVEAQKYEQAIPELTQAASLTPNSADPQVRLGEAYLNLGQDQKAMEAFDRAEQISATPTVWNNIAYQLSLKKAHLDVARRYAESAVTSTAASLRNASIDQLSHRDLRSTSALARYWDTLGWIEFADGNVDKALKYTFAAWQVSQGAEVADHLGQIHEKRGDKDKAEYFYAVSLNARRPLRETRNRLSALLGGDDKVDVFVEKYRAELNKLRTITLGDFKHESAARADFFVMLGKGTSSAATVQGVKFVSGDETLKSVADIARSAKYEQSFPDDTPVMLLRRGTLVCKASAQCTFSLALPEDVSSVD